MPRVLRIVLLWLVALAVPVQGLAAATMLHCGSGHASPAGAEPSHGQHMRADANLHVHEADRRDDGDEAASDAQATAEDADADAAGGGETVAKLHELSKSKCASCSACGVATALPAAPLPFDLPLLVGSVPAARPASAAVFLTDGPERPPRSFLA